MDNALLRLFEKRFPPAKKTPLRVFDVLFFTGITLVAIFVRALVFDIQSMDYLDFLTKWYNAIAAAPGFSALGLSVGNYNVPYLYLMKLMTLLPVGSLYAIKLFSCLFDFAAGAVMARVIWKQFYSVPYALGAYALTLFAPTVVLNGAAWAQCDIIYSFFLLCCVGAFLKNRPLIAAVMFGVAFSFKLQAVFLLPLLVWMWLARRIRLVHFLAIPAVYFMSLIPAWIAGRPLGELLTIYIDQTNTYNQQLSLNYPNPYTFFGDRYTNLLSTAGVVFAIGFVGLILYFMYATKAAPTPNLIVTFSLFSAMALPFLLPHMHDRYGFAADVLVLLYVLLRPKRYPALLGFTVISLAAYGPYLCGVEPLKLEYVAVGYLFCLGYVGADLVAQWLPERDRPIL